MTTAKAIILAILLTGLSAVIGVSTAVYVGYRKAKEKLNVDGGTLLQTMANVSDAEGLLHNIAADGEGAFGKRAAAIRASHPFTPPAGGTLTERQIQQFLAVKRALYEIDTEMAADMQREPAKEPSAGFLLKWNFFSRAGRLRDAEIAALEAQSMSFDEYNWVHLNIYTAMVAQGFKPEEQRADWGAEVRRGVDESVRQIDAKLNDPATPAAQREELERAKKSMTDGREALTDSAHALQQQLASVPESNKALVQKYGEELKKVFLSGMELDAIDIMKAMEGARDGQAAIPHSSFLVPSEESASYRTCPRTS